MFTVDDARRVQQDLGLKDHVAYVSEAYMVLAHTDPERVARLDLHDCIVHRWLAMGDLGVGLGITSCCLRETGWYEIYAPHSVKGLAL